MKLEVRMTWPLTWLGPAWAALCGALASGGLTLSGENLFFLLVALFLADALWGTLWHLIVEQDWFASSNWRSPSQGASLTAPPYTAPGSPSHRVFGRLGRKRAWWRAAFWPRQRSAIVSLVVALPLTLILAVVLGQRVIILTAAALAIMALALLRARRCGSPPPALRAILEMGFAWLAGHTAFAPLTIPSFLLAALYTVAYHSCLKLVRTNEKKRWPALLKVSQAAVIALLVFLRQPIAAGVLGLLLLPQMLLQPFLSQGEVQLWYLRRTRLFLMAGMLLAALAVR